jgi:hypothetical protein
MGAPVITPEEPQRPADNYRTLWYGALAWMLFSLLAVALRGIRWEETYEHALIITGIVPYPEGHPCFQYCRNVFSGQSYLSALVLWLIDSPTLVNGYRNVLQLAFCTIPVFLLGARLTGRVAYGHVAVVHVLLGIHRGLQSYYPIESWPHVYAIGQIGTGYALLVLALLLFDCWRTVWFLLGLMVAIHIGQLPVIGAVAGVQWLIYLYQGNKKRVLSAVGFFGLGLIPCIIFYAIKSTLYVPLPEEGAYAATGDIHAIWAAYTERYDLHRGFARLNPFWKSWIGVGLVLWIAGLCAGPEGRRPFVQQIHRWILLYSVILATVVAAIWGVHQVLGGDIPFLLLGWMPYRLTNHLAILLVPLALGVLLRGAPGNRAGAAFVMLVLIYAITYPMTAYFLHEELYERYVSNLDTPLWLLAGGAMAAALMQRFPTRKSRVYARIGQLAVILLLALVSPYAAACLLMADAVMTLLSIFEKRLPPAALVPAASVLLVVLLFQQYDQRESLSIHPLQAEVVQYLEEQGESDAMLVPPYWDAAWLARTRHPIFADYQAAHHMTYMPQLAPALKKMHGEVYGFPVDGDEGDPLSEWPTRSREEWQALAEAYEIDYVLAPTEMTLQMEPVLEGHPYDLYDVRPKTP